MAARAGWFDLDGGVGQVVLLGEEDLCGGEHLGGVGVGFGDQGAEAGRVMGGVGLAGYLAFMGLRQVWFTGSPGPDAGR